MEAFESATTIELVVALVWGSIRLHSSLLEPAGLRPGWLLVLGSVPFRAWGGSPVLKVAYHAIDGPLEGRELPDTVHAWLNSRERVWPQRPLL